MDRSGLACPEQPEAFQLAWFRIEPEFVNCFVQSLLHAKGQAALTIASMRWLPRRVMATLPG